MTPRERAKKAWKMVEDCLAREPGFPDPEDVILAAIMDENQDCLEIARKQFDASMVSEDAAAIVIAIDARRTKP